MKLDRPSVRMTAIKAVVDILMYHGSAAFDEDEDKGNDSDEDLFDDEEEQVRKKSVRFVETKDQGAETYLIIFCLAWGWINDLQKFCVRGFLSVSVTKSTGKQDPHRS